MLRRMALPTLLLAALMAFLAAPGENLRAASCGEKGDYLCEETETCTLLFGFFRFGCTWEYKYWTDGPTELEEVT